MAKKNLKIDQLAKLRQFREGDDVGVFLSTQFRQVVRALEQAYVKTDVFATAEDLASALSVKFVKSGNVFSFNNSSGAIVDVPNLSLQIESTGRPIFIGLNSTTLSSGSSLRVATTSGANAFGYFMIYKDAVQIANYRLSIIANPSGSLDKSVPSSALNIIDTAPGVGLITYSLKVQSSPPAVVSVTDCCLVAYEL